MPGKDGGKAKPLKAAKSGKKELDEHDLDHKNKQKAEAAAIKAYQQQAGGKGKKK
eukprot:CAMPEP_0117663818 /NCGR_PEP_ID=MMETSP0804-20121206/8829_1 /TAXON_ID=1074897 /ORGANISM="Tetraselmis astigmatica, Strain CCMP880" /LENGTH=54 /DNA_ID=CAMNT_0005470889 /DNA_START=127 /DNA_END=291 /DNA_ORIENTATION=-